MKTVESLYVEIRVGAASVKGDLDIPAQAKGLVIFAHGSGSSRFSPRNRAVAQALQRRGLSTLLFDLLTETEEQEDLRASNRRFDIDLLSGRLVRVIDWSTESPETCQLPIGIFGANTGAAAALVAAARRPHFVKAVVSRGGRPDLAMHELENVAAPTLLIVGGADRLVLELNKGARAEMRAKTDLVVIPRATHLFEEPGTLEEVSRLAADWFSAYLAGEQAPRKHFTAVFSRFR